MAIYIEKEQNRRKAMSMHWKTKYETLRTTHINDVFRLYLEANFVPSFVARGAVFRSQNKIKLNFCASYSIAKLKYDFQLSFYLGKIKICQA